MKNLFLTVFVSAVLLLHFAAGSANAEENLLINPGFETSELDGWTTDAGGSLQSNYNSHSGLYSARGWAFAEISQIVSVTAGQAYNLSLWVMSPEEDSFQEWGGAKLRLKWLDSNGEQIGNELDSNQIEHAGPHPWTKVVLNHVVAPPNSAKGKFICVMWAKDGAGQFDDASFCLAP